MAEVVLPDSAALAPEVYILSLAGTGIFSWRLRSEPCMNAREIAEFHHGDKINAVRDASRPGWLKLVDTAGWVKESHEEQLVWKTAQSHSSAQAADLEPSSSGCKDDAELAGKKSSKCSTEFTDIEDIEDMSPSSACSSGSSNSSTAQAHALFPALRGFFIGKSCRIGDAESTNTTVTSNVAASRWFTGQSCKMPLMPSEISAATDEISAPRTARPRWADMEDTDEEEMDSMPALRKSSTEQLVDEKNLDNELRRMIISDEPKEIAVHNTQELDKLKMIIADEEHVEPHEDTHDETLVPNPPSVHEQVVLKPKRHKRNRDLLQRKNKTQMCQFMVKERTCPFGDSCWFAHVEGDLKETETTSTLQAIVQNDVAPPSERTVLNPSKQKKNKALLKKRNKTELCRYLLEKGCCPFSETCWFAHSAEEIRSSA